MPPASRSAVAASRNTSMRPPARPTASRAQSAMPSLHAQRSASRALSPADSMASSRSQTPAQGIKRKERDYEVEVGEETNINVVVRCRGRNDREVKENSGVVVITEGARGKSVELSMGPNAMSNKTYHFDKVFSQAADQTIIYEEVVAPILDEMLQGFNCTIFAYGQTGTGKTYTMSGDMNEEFGLLSDAAGIIPRVLTQLFRKLEADDAENTVKCSFIELYNEELRDLISPDEHAKLKIFEDGQKKGHSATIVQGMEESHIRNASDGIKLLQEGSHKRQVAATKCNDLSSRSHTVFTVTVYTKRTTDDGEDFVSAGKLNLVDLAGSENIQRSGAENKRAAEAGLINKSLLTLGRVINALVDRGSHIPYRESKLTRLLQDSLGGRTKTCIIATVSPAKSNLEETISTLDYAFRAKNIRNKPQINQLISKKTLLREFTAEIEKLKSELITTRQRNGVYLSNEAYEEMTVESESRRILSDEQRAKIETMEANLRNKVQELFLLTNNFATLKKNNESTRQELEDTNSVLEKTELVLADTRQNLADETVLRKAHQATEEQLSAKGGELISTLNKTVKDVSGLHSKLRRRSDLQSLNRNNWQSTQSEISEITRLVEARVSGFQTVHKELLDNVADYVATFVQEEIQSIASRKASLQQTEIEFRTVESGMTEQALRAQSDMNEVLEEIKVLREDVKEKVGQGLQGLSEAAGRISGGVIKELETFHSQLHNSYSTLGKDFKNIFEELVKHVNTQRTEADELRAELAKASAQAAKSDEEFSRRLETCMHEERQQNATDRQMLLSQITSLINTSGVAQEERFAAKLDTIRDDMTGSRTQLHEAEAKYAQAMDVWSEKENILVDEVLRSRETLKTKLKQDWTTVNSHNTSIQNTTKSVHEETVRIVDAQMQEMATQMQALDDFVTRARSHNDSHHSAHATKFTALTQSVTASHENVKTALTSNEEHIESLRAAMTLHNKTLYDSLPPLQESLCQPLSDMREAVMSAPLEEYRATGETPQKVQYVYPTSLPRTGPHDELLGRNLPVTTEEELPDLFDGPPSPSKQSVYTDRTAVQDSIPQRPSTSDGGLREINTNVNAGSENLTAPVEIGIKNFSASMGPPPLKRHATENHKGSGNTRRLREGRENLPLSASVGTGRRLRSSPNS